MKIFDCFIYSDEEMLLDVRLNTMEKCIDKFVIVEASFKHNGDRKEKNFNFDKFKKFGNKINYIYLDRIPNKLNMINSGDDENTVNSKKIKNSIILEHYQRNMINDGLFEASKDDFIFSARDSHIL